MHNSIPLPLPFPLPLPSTPAPAPAPTPAPAPPVPFPSRISHAASRSVRGPTPRAWGPPPNVKAVQAHGNADVNGRRGERSRLSRAPGPRENGINTRNMSNSTNVSNGANHMIGSYGANGANGTRSGGQRRGRGRRRPTRTGPLQIPEEDFDFETYNDRFERPEAGPIAPLYNKSKSFFDELVSEKQMRGERNAAQRRRMDLETFGDAAIGSGRRNHRARGRGRRGRSRGRSHSDR